MSHGPPSITDEVERYRLTGSSDPLYAAWPGNIMERATRARDELRSALIGAIRRREAKRKVSMPARLDPVALTRAKVEPMVRGLFPYAERLVVLAMLAKSVVFLTAENIQTVLLEESFNHSAWTLANLYLAGLGAELLSQDAPNLATYPRSTSMRLIASLTLSSMKLRTCSTTVSAARLCRETRTKVWLLDIEYRNRETFAYSCEAYARILELGNSPAAWRALADEFSRTVSISDERVDGSEVARIVSAAVAARNGWKVILAQCAPTRRPRHLRRADHYEKTA